MHNSRKQKPDTQPGAVNPSASSPEAAARPNVKSVCQSTPAPDVLPDAVPSVPAETLSHTVPCRQKQAREFLQGRTPGVMQSYAPNAHADPTDGFVETDDTVHRLAHWREEAIY